MSKEKKNILILTGSTEYSQAFTFFLQLSRVKVRTILLEIWEGTYCREKRTVASPSLTLGNLFNTSWTDYSAEKQA